MFTYRGDAVPIYNVGGRPVFPEIFGAALFVIGLLICLWRWKRPAYTLMLLWFFISLIPAMVTPFSPNFVRTIAVVAGAVCVCRAGDGEACSGSIGRGIGDQGSVISERGSVSSVIRSSCHWPFCPCSHRECCFNFQRLLRAMAAGWLCALLAAGHMDAGRARFKCRSIHYADRGSGLSVQDFVPGGLRSADVRVVGLAARSQGEVVRLSQRDVVSASRRAHALSHARVRALRCRSTNSFLDRGKGERSAALAGYE